MFDILFNWTDPLRTVLITIDSIAFSLIDNAYNLIVAVAGATFNNSDVVNSVKNNLYVIIGIFALFRIAMFFVTSIISPDKLVEQGKGIAEVLRNFIIMFVLLIAVPFLFKEAYNLQKLVVEKSYVQGLFLNVQAIEKEGYSPGKTMRSIALGSLIKLNDNVTDCTGKCEDAVDAWNNMADGKNAAGGDEKGGFSIPSLRKYINVEGKTADGEKEYIYDYTMLVTFGVGLFITYVLFSFAIDIAVRSVELVVLEILSPLFIATYIDPTSAKSGPFSKWLKTVGKTYASLFIKLAIVAIMLLLMSLIDDLKIDSHGLGKLLMLIAILIFAKKAPKFISDMIGVDTEAGLSGLGIGKKLGSAALVGGALTKAGHFAAGAGIGAARQVHTLRKAKKALQKESGDSAFSRAKKEFKTNSGFGNRAKAALGSYFKPDEIKKNTKNWRDTAAAGLKGAFSGAIAGARLGVDGKDIKDINAQIKANQKDILKGAGYTSPLSRLSDSAGKMSDRVVDSVIGNKVERDKRIENQKNKELAEEMYGQKLDMDADGKLTFPGTRDQVAFNPKTMRKVYGKNVNGIEDVVASMIEPGSHFTTRDIGQTYVDSTGSYTTSAITAGTLVRDKKDSIGNVIYDVNGNAVKEAIPNPSGSDYKIGDTEISTAIKSYQDAVKSNGEKSAQLSVAGKTLNLTGEGVLEYEAAFTSLRNDNANTYISVSGKRDQVSQQLVELQANYASARSNLQSLELSTEYGQAKVRKEELESKLHDTEEAISSFDSQITALNSSISNAENQLSRATDPADLSRATDPADVDRLNKEIADKMRQKEAIQVERSKLSVEKSVIEKGIINCRNIMSDHTKKAEFDQISKQSKEKLDSLEGQINQLKQAYKDYERELETSVSYGSDLSVDLGSGKELLTTANSERFLSTTSKQKDKAREKADVYRENKSKNSDKK